MCTEKSHVYCILKFKKLNTNKKCEQIKEGKVVPVHAMTAYR
jgi:hypothetical protein